MSFPWSLFDPPPEVVPDRFVFPEQFTAGDSLQFRVIDSEPYQSSAGWVYKLYMVLEDTPVPQTISSVMDSGDFLLAAVPATTIAWTPGRWQWALVAVNNDGTTNTTAEGFVQVLPKLSVANADVRSHAKRTLDLIEALIEGRVTNDILESVIDNTRFMRMNPEQLLVAHSYYTAKVRSEEAKARVANGRASGRNVLYRFSTPH